MEIAAFIPKSFTHWPGKTAAVVFAPGCNFSCSYCHSRQLAENNAGSLDERMFFDFLEKEAQSIDSIVVTGGEPTIQGESLLEFLDNIKSRGFLVRVETNGYLSHILEELLEESLADYVAMDVKTVVSEQAYSKIVGRKINIANIIRSIEMLKNSGICYEFSTTFVPGLHSESSVLALAAQLKGSRRFVLQQFQNSFESADTRKAIEEPGRELLYSLAEKISGIKEVMVRTRESLEIVQPRKPSIRVL